MPLLTSWKKLKDWLYSHVHDGVDGSTKIDHSDLDGVGVADHHARYTDGEAVAAAKADGDISDAIAKKHTQGTDTTLGNMAADINANNNTVINLKAPAMNGDAMRRTNKISEAAMEDAADKRHTQPATEPNAYVNASVGAGDAGKGVLLDATGKVSTTMDGANTPTAGQKAALAEIASNTPGTGGLIHKFVRKTGIASATTTTFATVTTTNEAGANDGGSYSVIVRGTVSHASASPATGACASRSFGATYTRSMGGAGAGVNSAVTEIWESASGASASATRDISAITMTVTESGEYVTNLRINITLTGTSPFEAEVTFLIELSYIGFLTAPVIAAA